MTISPLAGRRPHALPGLPGLGRADLAVLAFCALGAGNLWARRGTGDAFNAGDGAAFVVGFALICIAGLLCILAVRRPAAAPGALICSASIAAQTVLQPFYLLPLPLMYLTGAVLAAVPLVRWRWASWSMVAVAAAVVSAAVAQYWTWGTAKIDVFAEVQGSAQSLLHGHNPYSPVYAIFLESPLNHPVYGSGSLNYGPAVVLVSLPARLLGDVRLTVVALNLSILAAALIWTRRAWPGRNLRPAIAALWVASPFVPFMVLMEWTDSFSVAGLVWWLVLRDRHRNWAIACLAVALASKPSMLPLMVPLLLWVRPVRGELLRATVGAIAIIAPFALWTGTAQFVYDTVGVFADLPVRSDGITADGLASVLGQPFVPGRAARGHVRRLRRFHPAPAAGLLCTSRGRLRPAHRRLLLRQAGLHQLLLHRRHGPALRRWLRPPGAPRRTGCSARKGQGGAVDCGSGSSQIRHKSPSPRDACAS